MKRQFYFALAFMCWTANPFIKKVIIKKGKMNTDEYCSKPLHGNTYPHILFRFLFKEKCKRNVKSLDGLFYILLWLFGI